MFYNDERLALFIDGANIYAASRALDFEIDYKSLHKEFSKRGRLLRAYYYTAILDSEDYSPIRPLVDWLYYNGYKIREKTAREFVDSKGFRRFKGDISVDLAVDAMEIAGGMDHAVIFSGNGEYVSLIHGLQRKGVRVTIVSTIRADQNVISDELRRQADNFIELDDLRETIGRPLRSE